MADGRVTLHYDDGSKIDFNSAEDAVFHVYKQGPAGIVELREEDGDVLQTRAQLTEGAKALYDADEG